MQKSTKKNHKKVLSGKKCLKPAISKRPPLRPLFSPPSLHIFVNICYFCLKLFRKMLKLILEPILGSERPKRAKMSPKEPSGASKNQKPSFSKTLKKTCCFLMVLGYRGLSRKPQEAEEGSQKAPKKSKTPKNRNPKSNPKIVKKWEPIFWSPL